MTGRERMLASCRFEEVDRPPVWLMRQAGRYMPEYMRLKGDRDFWTLVRTPELAAEITLQPIARFGMDAAIVFSDILIVPDALGVTVTYGPGGPELGSLVSTMDDVDGLHPVDAGSRYAYLAEALRLVKPRLEGQALVGFAGAPFTLAAYMVEGKVTAELVGTKTLGMERPEVLEALLGRLTAAVTDLLLMQVDAGADIVQIFDTWAGRLPPEEYGRWALPAVRSVAEALRARGVPVILYVNGVAGILDLARQSGCDVLSVDARIRLVEARERLGTGMALQGNLDPVRLLGPLEGVRQGVRDLLRATSGRGHIVNLGHGVLPPTPPEAVQAFVDAVREEGGP